MLGKPPIFLDHSLSSLQGEKVDFQMLLLGKAKFLGLQRVPRAVETELSLPGGCVPCDSLSSRNGRGRDGRGGGEDSCFGRHTTNHAPTWLHFSGSLMCFCHIRQFISIGKNPGLKHLQVDSEKLYETEQIPSLYRS